MEPQGKWFCFRCLNKSPGPGLWGKPQTGFPHLWGLYSLMKGYSDVIIPKWGVYCRNLNKCQGCSLATSNLHVTIARRIPKPSSKYSSPCSKHIAPWWGDELQYRVERMWRKISFYSISQSRMRSVSGDDLYRIPKLEPIKIPRQSRSLCICTHTHGSCIHNYIYI